MSDLELIKQIEQRIGKPLEARELNLLMQWKNNGYALNEQQLIGLNLDDRKLVDIAFLSQFIQLKLLSLYGNRITDLTVLQKLKSLTTLGLSHNRITDLTPLKELRKLTTLDLNANKITSLTALKELRELTTLYLNSNQITDLTPLKELTGLITLYLNSNQITDLTVLKGLKSLTTLCLGFNQITDLTALSGLNSLAKLDLNSNQITDLTALKGLNSLAKLDLNSNQITDLTALKELKELNGLTELDLNDNQIHELPAWLLCLEDDSSSVYLSVYDNPLESPPLEIIRQGNAAIKGYFDSLKTQSRKLNELKVLFVGDSGTGKTSLSKILRSEPFNPQESQTLGINIARWQHQDLTLHCWDFGGQETMHATHQFFLSKRSLYILVLDGHKDEDAEYWLKHIERFGGASPVLIVLNKMDKHPSFDVNRKHLLDKYQGIVGFYKLSCDTQQGLDEFKLALIKAFNNVEMLQTVWGESWLKVKRALESWQQPTISTEQYRELCNAQRVTDSQTQDILAQYLNDLGVVLYFSALKLHDTHVFKPRWITEAVYKIINAKQLVAQQGVLCLQDLTDILTSVTVEDYRYPTEKYHHIIELIKKFELCYTLDKHHILIPDLLDVQEPIFTFADKQPLRFRVQYDFLPKSIMPRFIVKRHADIKNSLYWRTGVVLYDKNTAATAIIRADDHERLIDIQVGGKQKCDYFALIRETLNEIHASFQKLEITELVPLPDNPNICLEYQELIGYALAGKNEYFVGKLGKAYSISELLNGIENSELRKSDTYFNNREESMSNQSNNIAIHYSVLAAKIIKNCLNTMQTSQADNDIKQLLIELLKQIEELNSKVAAEKSHIIEQISHDAEDLVNEINSDTPRKRNSLQFSLDAIKEAAIKLGEIATPIIEITEKINPFLLGF